MPSLIILNSLKSKVPLKCFCGESRVILSRSSDPRFFAQWECRQCRRVRKFVGKTSAVVEVMR